MSRNAQENANDCSKELLEKIFINGDLGRLTSSEKVTYYNQFCSSLGLNPLTKPFQLIKFQGKEILYATKDCTEQLRKINKVSIVKVEKLMISGDIYTVTVTAEDSSGRQDASTGAVTLTGLKGDAVCNAIMKAETKAKRRVTLSICGLGALDDSETDTIGDYKKIDITTGEVFEKKIIQNNIEDVNIDEIKKKMIEKISEQTDLEKLKNVWAEAKKEAKKFGESDFLTLLDETKDAVKQEIINKISAEDIPQ